MGGDARSFQILSELRGVGAIHHLHASALLFDEGGGGPATPAIADHQGVPALDVRAAGRPLCHAAGPGRASASASTAATTDPIQNHRASGVSRQPPTMK